LETLGNLGLTLFWSCAAVLIYVYWGYGALLKLILLVRGEIPLRARYGEADWPFVTILLTVHNEKDTIERRLQNLLEQDYTVDRIEVLVASDGSTDGTDQIVAAFKADGRVRLIRTGRLGKSGAQNIAMREAKGEIVVLTDAGASFDRSCVREMVAPFRNNSVGCTTAHLRLLERSGAVASSQGMYWSYELNIRDLESRVGILAVTSGQAMAFRRSLFRDLPAFVGDDCIIPLYVSYQGYRVVHCGAALAYDSMEHEDMREFRSRVRMTMRNWTGTWMVPSLLDPFKNPGYAFALWSHKLLRWLGSVALLGMTVAAVLLAMVGAQPVIVIGFGLFLGTGALGLVMSRKEKPIPVAGAVYSFLLANLGFMCGLGKALTGGRILTY